MSILGKVLVILNFLAAGAFFYLAAIDWARRQNWAYADYRHQLVIDALPLEESTTDLEGVRGVDKLSNYTLQQVFQQSGGPQNVNTQKKEVERVQRKLRKDLDDSKDEKAKRDKLEALLGFLPRTGPDRDALIKKIRTGTIEVLAGPDGPFERVFQAVLRDKECLVTRDNKTFTVVDPFDWAFGDYPSQNTRDGDKTRDPEEKRAALAHLLFNVTLDEKDHQRVMVVVGLKTYADEVNHQADLLGDMALRVRQEMARDLAVFEARQPELIREIQGLAEQLAGVQQQLTEQQNLTTNHDKLVKNREKDVEELIKRLKDARKSALAVLDTLSKEEGHYFQAENSVGKVARENQELERRIRIKERVGR